MDYPHGAKYWMDQTLMVFNVFVSKPSQANVLRYKVLIPLSTSSLSFAASVSALLNNMSSRLRLPKNPRLLPKPTPQVKKSTTNTSTLVGLSIITLAVDHFDFPP